MIIVGIASIPARISQLINTVNSLYNQVDKINLSLNHYTAIPDELKLPKIEAELTQGTDEQKFRKVEGEIYLSCDDDLIYPEDYVKTIKDALTVYDNHILTFHGRNFDSFPIQSYYKSKARKYRCLDKVADDIPVQIGGTGCMAFKPDKFSLSLQDFPHKYMADIQLSIKAKNAGHKIICLAHESGWIKYQSVENTIFERFRNDDRLQTSLINANWTG